ncbi:MAG TPA: threonine/serine exporter family protein, partial [Gemmatimonadaceae bacterium]
LVRLPSIMLLVPGSVGFRGLASLMERDYTLGMETGVAVLSALVALMAGLLFGSVLVPPRRYL